MLWRRITFLQLAFGALGLFGQNANSRWWAWPANPDPQAAERGKSVFTAHCAGCHGAKATGTAKGPNLIRSRIVRKDVDGSATAALVRTGVPGKGMPPVPLADPEMKELVAFLQWTLQKYDRVSFGVPAETYPLERLLTGNAEAGKAFFSGAGGCTSCHSVTGDLAGIGRKYAPVFLQSRFLMPRATKPKTVTVTLPSGEKVSGELRTINNYDIVMKDSAGQTRTFDAQTTKAEVQDPLAGHIALLPKYTDAQVHNMFAYLWSLQ
ncbi:MAG: cytochrome c, class [Bryobacterales bacterium]|nr:cytochrome c, class [Bryobacterales bacterium]